MRTILIWPRRRAGGADGSPPIPHIIPYYTTLSRLFHTQIIGAILNHLFSAPAPAGK